MPPLMEAINCNRNDLEILDELSRAGADISENDPYGQDSILHWVVGRKTPAVLNWCLMHGANIHASDNRGQTPLFSAARVAGHFDPDPRYQESGLRDMSLLLHGGADPTHGDKTGRTVLHYAAEAEALEAVRLLLEHGAPVNAGDTDGTTALMLAVKQGHDAIVALLLEYGAMVDTTDEDGQTALHLIADISPDAFEPRHMAVAERLIAACANSNSPDKYSFPPINRSASAGNVEMTRFLLRHGADPDGGDGVALQNAVFFEYDAIVALLLDAGAEAGRAYGEEQRTPLHVAAHEGYLVGVTALIDKNAPLDATDIDGETSLMTATRRQHTEVVQILLDRGADIRRADDYGNTPLSLAKRRGNAELIALLESKF